MAVDTGAADCCKQIAAPSSAVDAAGVAGVAGVADADAAGAADAGGLQRARSTFRWAYLVHKGTFERYGIADKLDDPELMPQRSDACNSVAVDAGTERHYRALVANSRIRRIAGEMEVAERCLAKVAEANAGDTARSCRQADKGYWGALEQ